MGIPKREILALLLVPIVLLASLREARAQMDVRSQDPDDTRYVQITKTKNRRIVFQFCDKDKESWETSKSLCSKFSKLPVPQQGQCCTIGNRSYTRWELRTLRNQLKKSMRNTLMLDAGIVVLAAGLTVGLPFGIAGGARLAASIFMRIRAGSLFARVAQKTAVGAKSAATAATTATGAASAVTGTSSGMGYIGSLALATSIPALAMKGWNYIKDSQSPFKQWRRAKRTLQDDLFDRCGEHRTDVHIQDFAVQLIQTLSLIKAETNPLPKEDQDPSKPAEDGAPLALPNPLLGGAAPPG
jgi:hypothetical protein